MKSFSSHRTAAPAVFAILVFAAAASPLRAAAWKRLGPFGGFVAAIAVDPTNPKIIYTGVDAIDVFKSVDGGGHWRKTGLVQSVAYTRLAVDPRNPKTVFAATYGGLFVTRNGGESWAAANTGLTDSYLCTVVLDPSQANVVYVGAMGGVFKSIDGGRTWKKVSGGIAGKTVMAPT